MRTRERERKRERITEQSRAMVHFKFAGFGNASKIESNVETIIDTKTFKL